MTEAALQARPAAPSRAGAGPAGWARRHGHLVLAVGAAAAFVALRPPVSDLQAATARADAVGHGVRLSYWFSWFGGTAPANYSVLTPLVGAVLGVAVTAGLAVLAVAALAGPLTAGTVRPTAARWAVTVAAVANLWSGRVPFCLGAALAVAAVLAWRRGRPWLAGVLNLLAALASSLPAAFVLLGLVGVLVVRPAAWRRLLPVAGLTAVGIGGPVLLFGSPGPMTFAATTLAWTVAIPVLAALLPVPREVRWTLAAVVAAALLLFAIPTSVGSTIVRFSAYVVPPLVIATARCRARWLALLLCPAVYFGGQYVVGDLVAASRPTAQSGYFAGLARALSDQPDRLNHRVEVVDTTTHRAAALLAGRVWLARGWEVQQDRRDNPLLTGGSALTAESYRRWLDELAVGWVAVPDQPAGPSRPEARLVTAGLPYLQPVWHDRHWRLYRVRSARPIVPGPARLVAAGPASLTLSVDRPTVLTARLRPSRHLHVEGGTIARAGPTSVRITLPRPGRYRVAGRF